MHLKYMSEIVTLVAPDRGLILNTLHSGDARAFKIYRATTGTTNHLMRGLSNIGGTRNLNFLCTCDSSITNTTGTYGTTSDIKLKQDITDANSQVNDIRNIRVVNYRLKKDVEADPDAPKLIGFVAQELEQVCPNLVYVKDNEVLSEQDAETNGLKGVKYSVLCTKMVKALQEAITRLESLEAQLEILKNQ